jgi:hypothetical protein
VDVSQVFQRDRLVDVAERLELHRKQVVRACNRAFRLAEPSGRGIAVDPVKRLIVTIRRSTGQAPLAGVGGLHETRLLLGSGIVERREGVPVMSRSRSPVCRETPPGVQRMPAHDHQPDLTIRGLIREPSEDDHHSSMCEEGHPAWATRPLIPASRNRPAASR